MKKAFIIMMLIGVILVGCNDKNGTPLITIDYLKENAKIGMTEKEIKDKFGQEVFRDFGDGSDVWIFDKTKEDYSYTPDLQRVAFDEIKSGNIQYQLYINMINKKVNMFSYFYKGGNEEVWLIEITPDGIQKEKQASHTIK